MEFAVPASLLCLAQNANRTVNLSTRFRLSTFIPGLAFWAFFDFGNAKRLACEHDKDLIVV